MGTSNRLRLVVATFAATLAVPGLIWVLSSSAPRPGGASPQEPLRTATAPALGTGLAASTRPAPSPRKREVSVRYTFDDGIAGAVRDREGQLALKARVAAGGALATVAHSGGLAVRFPQPCAKYGTQSCQRAILQSGSASLLNPGSAPFRYGASVLLAPSETSKGANVVQKGFSVRDSQFKLQVDGKEGNPTCVVVGTKSPKIYVATSSATVADGQWHQIECSRRDATLTIAVDGKILGQTKLPSSLSIVNTNPLCIGGKGTSANNDQFTGSIDDVYVTREA
jgi:hypothetical protein